MVDLTDSVMGEIGFQVDPERAVAEVGFWLARDFRSLGHGPRLLGLAGVLAHALELRGVIAVVAAENVAAIGLLKRCGWAEVQTTTTRRAFALWMSLTEQVV
jgi:RimJ/RimL family protein N-acetyltransferase